MKKMLFVLVLCIVLCSMIIKPVKCESEKDVVVQRITTYAKAILGIPASSVVISDIGIEDIPYRYQAKMYLPLQIQGESHNIETLFWISSDATSCSITLFYDSKTKEKLQIKDKSSNIYQQISNTLEQYYPALSINNHSLELINQEILLFHDIQDSESYYYEYIIDGMPLLGIDSSFCLLLKFDNEYLLNNITIIKC